MNWFTADWHFFHRNIIRYCDRPFQSEKAMRNAIINNYNEVVRKDDTCFILGDCAMLGTSQWEQLKGIVQRLNGTKHLVIGNHDEFKWDRYIDIGFTSVHSALWLMEGQFDIVMNHDPSVYCIKKEKTILLCGHVHTLFKSIPEKRVVNVGVDMWGFKPISFESQIKKELSL